LVRPRFFGLIRKPARLVLGADRLAIWSPPQQRAIQPHPNPSRLDQGIEGQRERHRHTRSIARLVREWRGRTHTVVVMETRFEYAGTFRRSTVVRVQVHVDRIDIVLHQDRLRGCLDEATHPIETVQPEIDRQTMILSIPARLQRTGKEMRIVVSDGSEAVGVHFLESTIYIVDPPLVGPLEVWVSLERH
jgi:hypothetical protein